MVPEVDVSSVYVGFASLLKYGTYAMSLNQKACQGARLIQFGGRKQGLKADTIIGWNHRTLDRLGTKQRGILVFPEHPEDSKSWYAKYEMACKDERVSVIAIAASTSAYTRPLDGVLRVVYLCRLISDGRFCPKKLHWLYGVPNPAELAAYRELLSSFVMSRIELAVCSTCFLSSIFGVSFSPLVGVLQHLSGINDVQSADLGLAPWVNYAMSREQMRCFHMNVDMVQSYAAGLIGSVYVEGIHSILEKGVKHEER